MTVTHDPGGTPPNVPAGAGADPFTIAGRELHSRLLLGTGGFRSLDTLAAAIEESATAARHRRPAPHRSRPSAARSPTSCTRQASSCSPTPPAASPRATRC